MTRMELDELQSELVAIVFWDECYRCTRNGFIESAAWKARRKRVREILTLLDREDARVQLPSDGPVSRVGSLREAVGLELLATASRYSTD
jgi:hypothetical protein